MFTIKVSPKQAKNFNTKSRVIIIRIYNAPGNGTVVIYNNQFLVVQQQIGCLIVIL